MFKRFHIIDTDRLQQQLSRSGALKKKNTVFQFGFWREGEGDRQREGRGGGREKERER